MKRFWMGVLVTSDLWMPLVVIGVLVGMLACGDPMQPASIEVTPSTVMLAVGKTLQLTATLRNPSGQVVQAPITWTSSDENLVVVNDAGRVVSLRAGRAMVRAETQNGLFTSTVVTGYATVSVAPFRTLSISPASTWAVRLCLDTPYLLMATVRDTSGHVVPNADVRWWSSVGGVEVDASGRVERHDPGFALVAIIATDGPPAKPLGNVGDDAPGVPADTAWLIAPGPPWPNEPETTDYWSCVGWTP